MAEVREILSKAADYLSQPGHWTQRQPQDGAAVCAVRAITHAASQLGATETERYGACKAVMSVVGVTGALFLWNDAPGRTQAEVVAAFRKAAQ